MALTETLTMIRQVIEMFAQENKDSTVPIAIYPFGKDGLLFKYILNNQFGFTERYVVDNVLCDFNPTILSSKELLKKDEEIILFVSTTDKRINKNIIDELEKSNNNKIRYINIIDPIIYTGNNNGEYYRSLRELLKPQTVQAYQLLRVGRFYDGGYVMVDDFSKDMVAYSFGISEDMSWDVHINEMTGMPVHMYDHTIPCAPAFHKGTVFHKVGLGLYDVDELLSFRTILENTENIDKATALILKMDIEGAEWDVLDTVEESLLKKFRQMVFEFHGLNSNKRDDKEKILRVLRRLNKDHQIVWIHGNNYTSAVKTKDIVMPDAIELLYVNRAYYSFENRCSHSFLDLDMPNMPIRKDYDMSYLGL